jgi:AraC-like DNA-binding protein
MKSTIRSITTERYRNEMARGGYRHIEGYGIFMDASANAGFPLILGQPYRTAEGRIAVVRKGIVHVTLDLIDYTISPGDLFFITPGAVFAFDSFTSDTVVDVAIFRGLPSRASGAECFVLHGDGEATARTMQYLDMLFDQFDRQPVHPEVIEPLFEAFILDTLTLRPPVELPPSATLLHRFVRLVNDEGTVKRTAAWYAERLCVSQSRLSAVVKEGSGMTITQWIDRALVQEAKVQLHHTGLSVAEVAERLGFATPSFFIHFFHKNTGTTPLQFRKGK